MTEESGTSGMISANRCSIGRISLRKAISVDDPARPGRKMVIILAPRPAAPDAPEASQERELSASDKKRAPK